MYMNTCFVDLCPGKEEADCEWLKRAIFRNIPGMYSKEVSQFFLCGSFTDPWIIDYVHRLYNRQQWYRSLKLNQVKQMPGLQHTYNEVIDRYPTRRITYVDENTDPVMYCINNSHYVNFICKGANTNHELIKECRYKRKYIGVYYLLAHSVEIMTVKPPADDWYSMY